MIDCIIALKRTSGQNLAAYTAYRQQWDLKRREEAYMKGGRKGGSGKMPVVTAIQTAPGPTNVLWDEIYYD